MRCRDAERALALYLDERHSGPLPPDVDVHLAGCPTCYNEWTALQHVEALFARAPLVEPAPGFVAAVLARIESDSEPVPAIPVRRRWFTRRRLMGGGLTVGVPLLTVMVVSLVIWGLIGYGLSILVPGWLQDPQVVNTVQAVLWQVDFWTQVLFGTLLTILGVLLPLIAIGGAVFVFLIVLAYGLTLSWGWLIGRVWWPGQTATVAVNG